MLRFLKANPSPADVASCLEFIVEGRPHVWADFTDVPIQDPELERIREKVLALQASHPPTDGSSYLNAEGQAILEGIIADLRSGKSRVPRA